MFSLPFEHGRQPFIFRQRQMWTSQHNHIQLAAVGVGQFPAGLPEHIHGDNDCFGGSLSVEGSFQRGCFGRDADHVKQGNTTGRCGRSAECLQLILIGLDQHPIHDRYLVERRLADQISEHWIKIIASLYRFGNVYQAEEDLACPVFCQVQANGRRAARDGASGSGRARPGW